MTSSSTNESPNRLATNPRSTVRQRLEEAREAYHVPERCFIHLAPADDPDNAKKPLERLGYERCALDDIDQDLNYGICPDGGIVIFDIDDYHEGDSPGPDLPKTFTTGSPHGGSHPFIVSDPGIGKIFKQVFGVHNPNFIGGEVEGGNGRNAHVVGPGSELESCDKDWHDCSQAGEGTYPIVADFPIAYLPARDVVERVNDARSESVTIPEKLFHDDGTPTTLPDDDDATDGPHTSLSGRLTKADKQLVETAKNASNGDLFSRLWAGNTSGYTSHSQADQALCNFLAFYCQKDSNRMARMFKASGLMRDKWYRDDYRSSTIKLAISGTDDIYTPSTSNILRDYRPDTSIITKKKVYQALLIRGIATKMQLANSDKVDRGPKSVKRALDHHIDEGLVGWDNVGRKTYYFIADDMIPDGRLDQLDIDRDDIDWSTDETVDVEHI